VFYSLAHPQKPRPFRILLNNCLQFPNLSYLRSLWSLLHYSFRNLWCFIPRFLWPIFENSSQHHLAFASEQLSPILESILSIVQHISTPPHRFLLDYKLLYLIFVVHNFCGFRRLFIVRIDIFVLFHCHHHQFHHQFICDCRYQVALSEASSREQLSSLIFESIPSIAPQTVSNFCGFRRLFVVSIFVLFHCDQHQLNLRLQLSSRSLKSILKNNCFRIHPIQHHRYQKHLVSSTALCTFSCIDII
jgi:hypothetical protein